MRTLILPCTSSRPSFKRLINGEEGKSGKGEIIIKIVRRIQDRIMGKGIRVSFHVLELIMKCLSGTQH